MSQDETRCRAYADDYSALLDGELAPERAAELSAHLTGCDRCRAQVAALRRVDALVEALATRALPGDLHARLRTRIDAEAAPAADGRARTPERGAPPRRRRLDLKAAAALAAAVAGVVYLVTPEERIAPEDLGAVPVEDVAVGLELDTIEDLDVIANLELLEALLALEEGAG